MDIRGTFGSGYIKCETRYLHTYRVYLHARARAKQTTKIYRRTCEHELTVVVPVARGSSRASSVKLVENFRQFAVTRARVIDSRSSRCVDFGRCMYPAISNVTERWSARNNADARVARRQGRKITRDASARDTDVYLSSLSLPVYINRFTR